MKCKKLNAHKEVMSVYLSVGMLQGMWHARGRIEVHTGFSGKPEGKNHMEDLEVDGRINLTGYSRSWMGGHKID
jgi:hypothetical protein